MLLLLLACKPEEPGFGGTGGGSNYNGVPPTVTISDPLDGVSLNAGNSLYLAGRAGDDDSPISELTLRVESNIQGVILPSLTMDLEGRFSTVVELAPGEHTLLVIATDADGNEGEDGVTVTQLSDGVPSVPIVGIEPEVPAPGQPLFAEIKTPSADPEGKPVTYSYAWTRDGVPVPEYADLDTVPELVTLEGEVWGVAVAATDGNTWSAAASDEVVVIGSGPVVEITITPERPSVSSTLECSYTAVDLEGDPITSVEAWWTVNAARVQTADSPLKGGFARGDKVGCEVIAISDATTKLEEFVVVGNGSPTISSVTLSGVPATESDTITCVVSAADPEGDALTTDISWLVNGAALTTGATIDGATFDKGDSVVCEATVSDAGGPSAAVSSSATTIQNTAPTSPSIEILPDPAIPGDLVSCPVTVSSTDIDPADVLVETWTWTVNGTVDASVTGQDYDTSGLSGGDVVSCTLGVSDGSTTVSSSTLSVTLFDRLQGTQSASSADLTILGTSTSALFGDAVADVGDIDGDGLSELAVAAEGYSSKRGAVFLFWGSDLGGSGTLKDTDAAYTGTGATKGDIVGAGQALVDAGDVDGDGFADLLVGAPYADEGTTLEVGKIYVLSSADVGLWAAAIESAASLTVKGSAEKDRLGLGFDAADLDGDGLSDLVAGVPYEDDGATNGGAIAIFTGLGTGTLTPSSADMVILAAESTARLGYDAVHVVGDVNGDGNPDLLVGAHNATGGTSTSGTAWLITSASSGSITTVAAATFKGNSASDEFGVSAEGADFDGDGASDIVIGARYGDASATDAGAIHLWYGGALSGSYSSSGSDLSWGSATSGDGLGVELAVGDIDADGLPDLSTGAYGDDAGGADAGAAWLLLGSSAWSGGAITTDAQAEVDGTAAGAELGRSSWILSDLDGDGYGEWAQGAEGVSSDAGAVTIFRGP